MPACFRMTVASSLNNLPPMSNSMVQTSATHWSYLLFSTCSGNLWSTEPLNIFFTLASIPWLYFHVLKHQSLLLSAIILMEEWHQLHIWKCTTDTIPRDDKAKQKNPCLLQVVNTKSIGLWKNKLFFLIKKHFILVFFENK